MKKHMLYALTVATAMACITPVWANEMDGLPEPRQVGDVVFITGGIGDEERALLDSVKPDYNLSILIAFVDGAFAGDNNVIIRNKAGEELVNTAAGPIFLAKLPDGSYTVEISTMEDKPQMRKQNVVIGKGKSPHIHVTWK